MEDEKKYEIVSSIFVRRQGTGTFLSMCIANIHKILEDAGIATELEIKQGIMNMIETYNKNYPYTNPPNPPEPPPSRDINPFNY